MTMTDTSDTATFAEKAKAYEDNFTAANKAVSDRATKPKPAKVNLKKVATELALDVKPRTFVDVAKDLARVERRQAEQRLELAGTDAEIASLQKELKALTDAIGKRL